MNLSGNPPRVAILSETPERMKRHLTENEIDFLVFGPEELSSQERRQWTEHIQHCALCHQHHDLAMQFRDSVSAQLGQGERRDDAAIADRIAGTSLALQLSFGGLKPPDDLLGTAVERSGSLRGGLRQFADTVARHPIRTAGAGLLAAALIISANLLLPSPPGDLSSARIHNGVLTAYDGNGNVLWTKPARGMPEGSTDTDFITPDGPLGEHAPVRIVDIHPTPGSEMLVFWPSVTNGENPSFRPETLYCLSAGGDLLWAGSFRPPEFNQFSAEKSGSWRPTHTLIIDSPRTKRRLFASIVNTPFSPSALVEIDGGSGNFLQTYSHYGSFSARLTPDSGDVKILLYGTNNAFQAPFLAMLDASDISGFGPTPEPPEFYGYKGIRYGKELLYVLFPRTEIGQKFSRDLQSLVERVLVSPGGSFVAFVQEFPTEKEGAVLYSFDSSGHVTSVTFSDVLQQKYRRLRDQGWHLRPLDSQYAEELKNAVRYWNGKRFVHMNKRSITNNQSTN